MATYFSYKKSVSKVLNNQLPVTNLLITVLVLSKHLWFFDKSRGESKDYNSLIL